MSGVRRLWLSGLVALCVAAGGLGVLSAPASALVAHRYLSQLTEVPAEPGVAVSGPFGAPAGLASEAGDLYVADTAHSVVDEFNSAAGFVKQLSNAELEEMAPGVAVDRALGYTYALGSDGLRLFAFGSLGEPVGEGEHLFGLQEPKDLAVDNSASPSDPAAGDLYLGSPAGFVAVIKPEPGGGFSKLTRLEGTPSGPLGHVSGVAVDEANGDLLVVDEEHAVVDVFKPKASGSPGVPEYEFLFEVSAPAATRWEIGSVAFESSSGDIYVAARLLENTATGFHAPEVVDQFGPSGELIDQVNGTASGPFEGRLEGVVVGSNGDLYVSDTEAHVVDVFSPPLTLPDVSVAVPSGVQSTGVTLTGAVNPNGEPVSACVFEYGITTSYGSAVPCSPAPGPVAGAVPVAGDLEGLAPGTVYHYRVAATGEEGVTEYSADETVATAPAVEGNVLASGVTSFAATLSGVLQAAEVTPEYHFAYGLTSAYGSSWPQPDADADVGGQQTVTQTVTGLQPDTTYHYALQATDFGGGVSTGPDATFTTRPLVPPGLSTGGAQEVEGTSATVTGTLDPEGLPTTYHFEYGTSTAYGSSWPLVQVFAGSGSASEGVAVAVPNLQPATVYHYRLVASNEDGTSYGADATLATPGYPVSVVQEPAVLSTKLGFFNPEAGHSAGKSSKPKGKHRGKAKQRGKRRAKAKGGRKGGKKG
jgi:hypothetical protein